VTSNRQWQFTSQHDITCQETWILSNAAMKTKICHEIYVRFFQRKIRYGAQVYWNEVDLRVSPEIAAFGDITPPSLRLTLLWLTKVMNAFGQHTRYSTGWRPGSVFGH
jgi:hypothetical protein